MIQKPTPQLILLDGMLPDQTGIRLLVRSIALEPVSCKVAMKGQKIDIGQADLVTPGIIGMSNAS